MQRYLILELSNLFLELGNLPLFVVVVGLLLQLSLSFVPFDLQHLLLFLPIGPGVVNSLIRCL